MILKPLIELVVHCYAVECPHYAQALVYQLSSLVLHKPIKTEVRVTVVTSEEDGDTLKVLKWGLHEGIDIRILYEDSADLGRRAIGRNFAALSSYNADVVWFSDCDQVYREGILDKLIQLTWPENAVMIFPRYYQIQGPKAGDELLKRVGNEPRLFNIFTSEFTERQNHRAIGGVQIVEGDFAREHGYLRDEKRWQTPTDGSFERCRCDIAYRKACLKYGDIVAVDLPGMYRIQHSVRGRNVR